MMMAATLPMPQNDDTDARRDDTVDYTGTMDMVMTILKKYD